MPDTPANQKAYPQPPSQKKGLGFPLLRLIGLIGLSCGAVLDVAMGPYRGKLTSETALLRQLLDRLEAGDVLLGDALFSNYWTIALMLECGVDLVSRHDGKRHVDFRQGRPLGRRDHVVPWHKQKRPSWMSQKLHHSLPDTLSIRETRVEVSQKGFRCRHLLRVTTLLDPQVYPRQELAMAFRSRWHAELDVRDTFDSPQFGSPNCAHHLA
jgi:hypothetical protein